MKKLIALLLALVMVFGLVACGEKEEAADPAETEAAAPAETEATPEAAEPKEEITLHYYINNGVGEQADTGKVEERLTEILDTLPGYEHISIDLHAMKDVETEFTLAQTAGDPIDMCTTYRLNFASRVTDGDFLQLDDLVAQFPDLDSDIPEYMLDYGKINGEQYYIPSYQELANIRFVGVPEEYFKMYETYTGNDKAKVTEIFLGNDLVAKLDFFEDLCLAVREGTGLQTKWIDIFPINWQLYMGNCEYIGTNYGPINIIEGEMPSYWPLTDEYKTVYERLNKWYDEGLVHPDYLTIESSNFNGDNILNDESFVNLDADTVGSVEHMEKNWWSNYPTYAFCTKAHPYIPSQYAAGGNAIYVDSEHPVECMMIIELLMTEKCPEFYNTLCYGVEGIHWEWVDEANGVINKIQSGGEATYTARAWAMGNTFNKWLTPSEDKAYYDHIDQNINNSPDAVLSPVTGISWDLAPIQDQIDQSKSIYDEYTSMLVLADDFEATYNEMLEKIKLAGAEDIVAEITAQYNAFIAG